MIFFLILNFPLVSVPTNNILHIAWQKMMMWFD
jgi:hypothetical protein